MKQPIVIFCTKVPYKNYIIFSIRKALCLLILNVRRQYVWPAPVCILLVKPRVIGRLLTCILAHKLLKGMIKADMIMNLSLIAVFLLISHSSGQFSVTRHLLVSIRPIFSSSTPVYKIPFMLQVINFLSIFFFTWK